MTQDSLAPRMFLNTEFDGARSLGPKDGREWGGVIICRAVFLASRAIPIGNEMIISFFCEKTRANRLAQMRHTRPK